MADNDNDTDNETEDERFDRLYNARREAERAAEARTKKLKEMGLTGDVLDAIGDAVYNTFTQRVNERRQAEEDADQSPSRTKTKKPGFLQGIGLVANDD